MFRSWKSPESSDFYLPPLVLTQWLISRQTFESFYRTLKIFGQKNELFSPVLIFSKKSWESHEKDMNFLAVARNLCAGGQARGAPVTPVSRGV